LRDQLKQQFCARIAERDKSQLIDDQ